MCSGQTSYNAGSTRIRYPLQRCRYIQGTSCRVSLSFVSENCEHDIVNLPSHRTEGNIKLFTSLTFGRLINWGFSLFFISPHDGGYTLALTAVSRKVFKERDNYKGKYLGPFGIIEDASENAKRKTWQRSCGERPRGL
jgi:hypothetical protein